MIGRAGIQHFSAMILLLLRQHAAVDPKQNFEAVA
jgi:hypothetical protein